MKKIILFSVFFIFIIRVSANQSAWQIYSPDQRIKVEITQLNNNNYTTLVYEVVVINGKNTIQVLEKSPLGIVRKDQSFAQNLTFFSSSKLKEIDEKYNMLIGRQTAFRNHANEMEYTFKNSKGALLKIVFRAYNDGIAFKYVFPEESAKTYTVTKELTGFKFAEGGKAWIQPYDKPTKWTPGYEKYYENSIAIGTPSPNKEGWAFPALFETQQAWAFVTESNLAPNYCGCRLEQNAANGIYKIRFPEPKDGQGTGKVLPSSKLPWIMPWRTIIIGSTLNDIFNSNMVNNLADASSEVDYSWVKPGKSSWSWLTDNESPKVFETMKKYVDLSAEMHWEYCLVDANWDLMKGGDIKQLVEYANSKNVGILMWYNSGGKHNKVSERPRDIISDHEKCAAEFSKLQLWGVKGVKIDFWQSDKQNIIALYHDVLKLAAQHHLLVNLHGCTLPRGWSRTYPNLLTIEAVKGEEAYLFDSEYPSNAPVQNSILPFARNVVGPMDYTPVVFSNLKNKHLTSNCHELALSVIFNSGILHLADNEKSYKMLPEFVKDFLSNIPVVFDETKLISGYPGNHILIAARKGNKWYIAGINSSNEPKTLLLACDFLNKGQYILHRIADAEDKSNFNYTEYQISYQSTFQFDLLPFGGIIAEIKPQ